MLSTDEIAEGTTFILKLPDADGNPIFWMETLKGDVARHWYDIYRGSDWQAVRRGGRCLYRSGAVGRRRTHPKIATLCRDSTAHDEFDRPDGFTSRRLKEAGAPLQFRRASRLMTATNSPGSTGLAT